MREFRRESGASLPELLAMTLVLAMGLMASLHLTTRYLHQQSARNSVYELQSHLRAARVHAITRVRPCRFILDETRGRIRVLDIDDPADPTDDVELSEVKLASIVGFRRPGGGAPITLSPLGDGTYHATFTPEGTVSAGAGDVVVETASGSYRRVILFGAGGIAVQRWNGSAWKTDL